MAGYSSFTVLRKIQNHEKYRKAQIRHELQKKKEKLLEGALGGLSGYNFPNLTDQEIEEVKGQIKINLKEESIKMRKNSLVLFLIATVTVLFFMIMYAQEIEARVNVQQIL